MFESLIKVVCGCNKRYFFAYKMDDYYCRLCNIYNHIQCGIYCFIYFFYPRNISFSLFYEIWDLVVITKQAW